MLTTPLVNVFLTIAGWQRRLFGPSSDEKLLFREGVLEASKFTVSSSYACHWLSELHVATELAVMPELVGVLKHPEHPPGYATGLHNKPRSLCDSVLQ
jgi:hypothetical protein